MHDTDTESELRSVFARQAAQLPIQRDFEHKVGQRIRARRLAHRAKVLTVSGFAAMLAVAGGVVVARQGTSSNIIQTEAPASSTVTSATSTTTTANIVLTTMIDVVGTDYRDAQQRLAASNARVLLALEEAQSDEGTVTRTTPAAGEPIRGEIIVHVAWNRPPVATLPPSFPGLTSGMPVSSTNAFAPAGLVAGLAADPDPRCDREGLVPGVTIRFLHGELVGCVTGRPAGVRLFVWLDQLDTVDDVVATMPDFIGLDYDEAMKQLTALGPAVSAAGISWQASGPGTGNVAKVRATIPAAGQPITRLGGVTLSFDGAPSR